MLDRLRQDVRYAIRALTRTPLFAMIAVLSVAVGVGSTTSMVTFASTLLLRPPPGVGNPERLVSVGRTQDGRGFDTFSYPNFVDYRAGATTLAGLAAVRLGSQPMSLGGSSGAEPVEGGLVSASFFDVLQARPFLGRFFLPEDDRAPGATAVIVLSHAFWRDRFGSDSSIIGKTVTLNGAPFTVVGVAAERFQGPFVLTHDLWVPLMSATLLGWDAGTFASRGSVQLIAIGRLAPNASIDAAQAELGAIAARLEREYPDVNRGKGLTVTAASLLPGEGRRIVATFMAMLFAIATLVLVIASTNVAGMLLARAAARRREIAVRLAIGASRAQLVRQLVTESVILFAVAGAAGVLLARVMVSGLMSLIPRLPVQLGFDPRIDWRVLAFALGASLVTGIAAGLFPAVQSSQPELVPALKADAVSGRRQRLRSALLVSQIAFSMLLLIVAGLFGRALQHARGLDAGFDATGVHTVSLDFDLPRYDRSRGDAVANELLTRSRELPQVSTTALTAMLPISGGGMGLGGVEVEGRSAPDERRGWNEDWNVVTPAYFEALRIPIVRGRAFTAADRAGVAEVAILNETFARTLFPGQDPLGRTIKNDDHVLTIVGVARDSKYRSLGESPRNFIYVAFAQRYTPRMTLIVRGPPGAPLVAPLRRMISQLDTNLPILSQRTLEENAALALFPQRLALYVAGSLGGVALLLALLGIYGVTAFSVAQRTREIGVRVALGAQRGHVLGMVLRQGAVLAVAGVLAGAAAALGITRLLSGLLYGVPATDAIAFGGAALLLGGAALAASWIPARRAASVDPVVALRAE
ncbi:MAG TPA: ABC transporter permease [Gemmatimonadaceae bacterium]|nr:ABC transporter permease [Gemmatimonadaceae bacterium]